MGRTAKIITSIYLLIVVSLILIPPIAYHYQYPFAGDDSAFHLTQMDAMSAQGLLGTMEQTYVAQSFTWLIAVGDMDTFFVWFNYGTLAMIAVMIWWFGYKLFNWHSGILASALAVFVCPAMLGFFTGGTIYNPINMWLFVLPAIMCFLLWQKEDRPYYCFLSLLLFAIAGLYHSLTAMVVLVGMGGFLGGWTIYCIIKKRDCLLQAFGFSCFFLITNLAIPYLLNPLFKDLVSSSVIDIGNISSNIGPLESPPRETIPLLFWTFKLYSPWALIVLLISIAVLWAKKTKPQNVMMLAIFGCFGIAYCIGAFTELFPESMRFGMDMGIMAGIVTGCLAGQALIVRQRRLFTGSIYGVVGLAMIPAVIWLTGYTSCYTPADQEAVLFLNSVGNGTYTTSSQIQPKIYERFTQGIEYSYPDGDYVVVRNEPMTCQCDPNCSWKTLNDHYPNFSIPKDYDSMELLGEWEYRGTVVSVYR